MSPTLSPDPKQVAQAIADTRAVAATRHHAPDRSDYEHEFPNKVAVTDEKPDGSHTIRIDLHDPEDRKRYFEMHEPWRAAENEVGAERSARIPTVDVVDPQGRYHRLSVGEGEKRARAHGMKAPGNRLWFLGAISGRWLQCGHRASFADVHGRCTVCGEVQ